MRTRTIAAMMVAVGAIAISGCGAGATRTVTMTTKSSDLLHLVSTGTPSSCDVYLAQHDASVRFTSDSFDVQPECSNLEQVMALSGELWTGEAPPPPAYPLATICTVEDPQGNVSATIRDDADGTYGQEVCTRFVANGWTEH